MANSDRMTIYMNEQDKQAVEKLEKALVKRGVDVKDNRGKPSTSKMFRYLVQQELARLHTTPNN